MCVDSVDATQGHAGRRAGGPARRQVEEGEAAAGPARLLRPSRFLSEIEYEPDVFERWEVEEAPMDEGPPPPQS